STPAAWACASSGPSDRKLVGAERSDDGPGAPSTEVEHIFFAERPGVHALALLRRRLQGLFGRSFQLEVWSELGEGTTVTLRIPLWFEVGNASLDAVGADTGSIGAWIKTQYYVDSDPCRHH